MKLNKIIFVGVIFIILAGVIFLSDILNPIIRPITHLFLMGSSKGKDIMFFGLFGLFLILSQSSNLLKKDIDVTKYLKISILIGSLLLVLGIVLEIIFRVQMGIALNTVFCSMNGGMSSTSILHTHLLKAVVGAVLVQLMGPIIQTNINTGVGLYPYVPQIANIAILIIPILFITLVLAIQKRSWLNTLLLSFFSACLIIGSFDGGLFSTPAITGICGLYLIYRNGLYIEKGFGLILNSDYLLDETDKIDPPYRNKGLSQARFLFNRFVPYMIVILIIILRFTVAIAGAECDYYTVDIANATDDIDLGNISIEAIDCKNNTDLNKITYHINSSYNEMKLINDLKIPLNNSCEYYTVSWNTFSYLSKKN